MKIALEIVTRERILITECKFIGKGRIYQEKQQRQLQFQKMQALPNDLQLVIDVR